MGDIPLSSVFDVICSSILKTNDIPSIAPEKSNELSIPTELKSSDASIFSQSETPFGSFSHNDVENNKNRASDHRKL